MDTKEQNLILQVVQSVIKGTSLSEVDERLLQQLSSQNSFFKHLYIYSHAKSITGQEIYSESAAFAAFIENGSNVELYKELHILLRKIYQETENSEIKLLDVGTGTGNALVPALTTNVTSVHVLEPSASMLSQCVSSLKAANAYDCRKIHTLNMTLQEFINSGSSNETWDIVQATFSLQNISNQSNQRVEALKWLSKHSKRVLIAEFDVQDDYHLPTFDEKRITYLRNVIEKGIQEFDQLENQEIGNLVCQGFIMPMFFGYFDQNEKKINYEQSAKRWQQELEIAGFKRTTVHKFYNFWWADAFLLEASSE